MRTTKQSGFTLIEVLVSVFVLALGVIGVAGMQLVAMRNSQQSQYQTVAVQLASELADKMRANAIEMKKGASSAFLFSYDAVTDGTPDPVNSCFSDTGCTAEQMAAFDIYQWKMQLAMPDKDHPNRIPRLPGGRVKVCSDAAPYVASATSFSWDCPETPAVGSPMVIKIGWQGKGKNLDGSDNTDGKYPPSVVITVESYSNPQQ